MPADRPLLLYLCSSPFITPHEVAFVRRWIEAIAACVAIPQLRRAAILIRPHPQNAAQWSDFDPSEYEAVGIWPRAGANPVDTDARADYYDSMFHSVAVVGVNTSALIESGIVGRPVYTVLADEFAGQQEGTLHFQHLQERQRRAAARRPRRSTSTSRSWPPAVRGECDPAKSRAFVEAFIRPHGLDMPAAAQFVEVHRGRGGRSRAPAAGRLAFDQRCCGQLLRRWPCRRRCARRSGEARRRDRTRAAAPRPLRFLFVLGSPEYLRYFDSTMPLLADRGHHVAVAVNWLRERKQARLGSDRRRPDRGARRVPEARRHLGADGPRACAARWTSSATCIRGSPRRRRCARGCSARCCPRCCGGWIGFASLREPTLARLHARPAGVRARRSRSATRHARVPRRTAPDAVIVSPLVDAASDQVDVVRAAQAAGIPVVAAIASWDNLTNKGHMRVVPDLVTVWNEQQKRRGGRR